ncbi:MAG: TIGR02221 family CRISPR-associated protein, partial [Chloroflexi bacterium]|nr:TIGR02221 family CRISPR-associated protein [Chloroflexota bacterium]
MRVIITFLGMRPTPTEYLYQGQTYTGRVFAEAMRGFVAFDRMLVLTTPQAREASWFVLEELGDPRIAEAPIPLAQDEAQLWSLFDCLTGLVGPGDTVIYDITHGLRFIPFVVFLAAAYLRKARGVGLEAIYYGAFEMGHPAPVLDLSPFVQLLDWLTATGQFLRTGDARELAGLLHQEGLRSRSGSLKTLGDRLGDLSLAMMLCRPLEVMGSAEGLDRALDKARADLAACSRPFELLAERIRSEYASRALPEPTSHARTAESLRRQLALVAWYLENNQVIQAITLAREWLITAVGWRQGRGFLLAREARKEIEDGLNGLDRLTWREGGLTEDELNDVGRQLLAWPEAGPLQALVNPLFSVRNDLDHAGMNPNPMKASTLARRAREEVWPALEALAASW